MSDYLVPIGMTILPSIGGFAGAWIKRSETHGNSRTWFKALKKPSYQPPPWVFSPVWTSIYCTMGYASYMVWRDGDGFGGKAALPLACYGTQLAMNWAWTPVFFKAQTLGLATALSVSIWGAIIFTMVTFHPVNPTASYLLLPYLGWTSFATFLSYKIWRLNKDRTD